MLQNFTPIGIALAETFCPTTKTDLQQMIYTTKRILALRLSYNTVTQLTVVILNTPLIRFVTLYTSLYELNHNGGAPFRVFYGAFCCRFPLYCTDIDFLAESSSVHCWRHNDLC